jgi:hypothetical protein
MTAFAGAAVDAVAYSASTPGGTLRVAGRF